MLVPFRRVQVCSDEEADCLDLKNIVVEASGYSSRSQHAAASLHKNKNVGARKNLRDQIKICVLVSKELVFN